MRRGEKAKKKLCKGERLKKESCKGKVKRNEIGDETEKFPELADLKGDENSSFDVAHLKNNQFPSSCGKIF